MLSHFPCIFSFFIYFLNFFLVSVRGSYLRRRARRSLQESCLLCRKEETLYMRCWRKQNKTKKSSVGLFLTPTMS
uniref:Putative secreted protein n=1 Tax=Ixodes ricinus TaxID=34613 RepID=A0A6B0U423_IXORI